MTSITPASARQGLRRHSVSALGVFLGILALGHLAYDNDHLLIDAFEVFVPLIISLTLIVFGGWLNRRGYSPDQVSHIAGWIVGGILLLALVGGWVLYLMLLENLPPDEIGAFLVTDLSVGAGAGALVGLYNVRRQSRHRDAERSHAGLEAAQDGIAILNEDIEYILVNEAHAEIYGYDDTAVFQGESWRMCYAEEQLSAIEQRVLPELEEDGQWRGELIGQRRDGTTFPQELALSMQDDGSVICIVRDITEQKRREQQLADLHTATRELMTATTHQEVCEAAVQTAESILDKPITGIWLYDADSDALEPCGATQYARDLFDGIPTFPRDTGLIWRAWEDGETKVYDDLRDHPSAYNSDTAVRSELHLPVGTDGILSIASEQANAFDEHDITVAQILASNTESALTRAEREHSLREQHAFMESVLDSLSDLFYVLDPDGTFQQWNEQLRTVTGYSESELEDMLALTLIPEEDQPQISEAMMRVYGQGTTESRETELVTKSGERIPYQLNGAPLYDSDENIVGLVGTGRDITTRKLREDRLTVISRVLRHNLRNDMNSIHGHTEHVLRQLDDPELCQSLRRVVGTAEKLTRLAENARRIDTALERQPDDTRLNLAEVVQTAVDEMAVDGQTTDLHIDVPPDIWVSAVETLRMALTEAIENAIVHHPSGTPTVRVSASRNSASDTGEWVTITIADDGEVIPPMQRDVLIEGETPLNHGSGLGLWLINWVVIASGGRLSFETSEMGGNAVCIELQLADPPAEDSDSSSRVENE